MKLSLQQAYPASINTLWKVFGDPDYPHKKYHALGITRYEVHQLDVSANTISLDMTRTLNIPLDRAPAFVQKLLHPEQALRYISHWQLTSPESASFDLKIVPQGLPVTINATGSLVQPDSNTSTMTLTFDIAANVPFLGGKIESLIAQQLEKSYHSDHAFTLRYLEENV
jgi:hypothetical protein